MLPPNVSSNDEAPPPWSIAQHQPESTARLLTPTNLNKTIKTKTPNHTGKGLRYRMQFGAVIKVVYVLSIIAVLINGRRYYTIKYKTSDKSSPSDSYFVELGCVWPTKRVGVKWKKYVYRRPSTMPTLCLSERRRAWQARDFSRYLSYYYLPPLVGGATVGTCGGQCKVYGYCDYS